MELSVKVYCTDCIRRFTVDKSKDIYLQLSEKMKLLYPDLNSDKSRFFWKDEEGDLVNVTCDDDLKEAVKFNKDSLFRIFFFNDEKKDDEEMKRLSFRSFCPVRQEGAPVHNVICDGCDGPVVSPRFKCLICPDYDLCLKCESKRLHDHHPMVRVSHYDQYAQSIRLLPAIYQCIAGSSLSGRESTCSRRDYLSSIGKTISDFLKKIGIENTVAVETDGHVENLCGKNRDAKTDSSSGATTPVQQQQPEVDNAPPVVPPASSAPNSETNTTAEGPDVNGWSWLEKSEDSQYSSDVTISVDEVDRSRPQLIPVIHQVSDPKIRDSLQKMLLMGFNNDNGWLTRLLELKGGDIDAVLSMIEGHAWS